MSVDFDVREFMYPVSIVRLRMFLEKSQWFEEDQLRSYQIKRLRSILRHAYDHVPYYRNIFDELSFVPEDVDSIEDIRSLPTITRETLRNNFDSLKAENAARFRPTLYRTSGSTGEPAEFYLDRNMNILEFCYYWRYWSWAGYRLGMPFAEFTLHHFLSRGTDGISDYDPFTKRLCLNSAQLSRGNAGSFAEAMRKYGALFLKGAPSAIHTFVRLLEEAGRPGTSLKAVFTTGELLLPHQRERIERYFNCRVVDSFGHMERIVAISQCPAGSYHIHPEYGLLEIEEIEELSSGDLAVGKVVGTSLHNLAMPLVKYETGDIIAVERHGKRCSCGRGLSVCRIIYGRRQNILVTPDGRYLTNIFILFRMLEGALWTQIAQEERAALIVRIVKGDNFSETGERAFLEKLKDLAGAGMKISVEYIPHERLAEITAGKYSPVVSNIDINL